MPFLEGFVVLLSAECFGVEEEVTGELCCAACKTAPDFQWQSPVFPVGVLGLGVEELPVDICVHKRTLFSLCACVFL